MWSISSWHLITHLQLLMECTAHYTWPSVTSFHLAIATAIEQCRLTWLLSDIIWEKLQTFFTIMTLTSIHPTPTFHARRIHHPHPSKPVASKKSLSVEVGIIPVNACVHLLLRLVLFCESSSPVRCTRASYAALCEMEISYSGDDDITRTHQGLTHSGCSRRLHEINHDWHDCKSREAPGNGAWREQ